MQREKIYFKEVCLRISMTVDHIFMPEDHMDKLYNSRNPIVKFIHTNRLEQIVKNIPQKNGLKILDAGCGEGHLIERLLLKNKGNTYFGIDIEEVALRKAKRRCSYSTFIRMNLANIGFDDELFDLIVCSEVLEHLYEYEVVIKELIRVLKKDGYLIITFPNEFLWTICRFLLRRRPIKVPDHVNAFNPRIMESLINLKLISVSSLPLKLPFFLSLGWLMKFRK